MKKIVRFETEFAGKPLVLETGKLANMASGSVTLTHGDVVLLATATIGGAVDADFFPLTVDFLDKFYASGKIKGSRFVKREGRPSDSATLTSRLIDRPMRPMFPKGMRNAVQIIVNVLSTDMMSNLGPLSMTAVSSALMIAGMPFEGPVAGVRIGRVKGTLILNPSYSELEEGDLDLIVAGTLDAITMVECGAKEVSPEDMILALDFAHGKIKELCDMQIKFVKEFGEVKPLDYTEYKVSDEVINAVKGVITDEMVESLYVAGKKEFAEAKEAITEKVLSHFEEKLVDLENPWKATDLNEAIEYHIKGKMRNGVLATGRRLDGRTLDGVREVSAEVGILPRTHGSGLFNRGATQVLTVLTLGGPSAAMTIDEMDMEYEKTYIHYYNFPPFSVGEAKGLRSPGRREIGHGMLAERSLLAVLPNKSEFPYTMLLVSETLTCNGSSSMASVCGSTLALMDAGVPIKAPVVGIAMGLVMNEETGEYKILSDIQAQEDFLGDMDFKVAGTGRGITALQLDIKIKGLKLKLLEEAIKQAKEGQAYIWSQMEKTISKPRPNLSKYAPLIMNLKVDVNDIARIIGKGGETIQGMTKEFGVEINIDDDGTVIITAPDQESGNAVIKRIEQITYKPKAGDEFEGKVVKIMEFGAFVEMVPGVDGLVHISKLAKERVNRVEDVVKVGDKIKVKLAQIDEQGRYNLHRIY